MQASPIPENEAARLAALKSLKLLDTDEDPAFERITSLARELFDIDIAAVSLIDHHRQWFKSIQGADLCQTGRDVSFCGHAIHEDASMIVEDALADPRFDDNPLVTDDPGIRFYAGVPLRPLEGQPIGVLCLMHGEPRRFSDRDQRLLETLAAQAEDVIHHHLDRLTLAAQKAQSERSLARYSAILSEAAAGIIRIDHRGIVQSVNPAALELFGYTEDELLGENVKRIMPARDATHHDEYIDSYLAGRPPTIINKGRAVKGLHRSGQEIPIQLAVSRVDVPGQPHPEFIGILTDLSDLKEAQRRQQEERALLRSVIEASADPIFAKDGDGNYVLVNQAAANNLGMEADESGAIEPGPQVDPDTRAAAIRLDREVMASGRPDHLMLSTRDGTVYNLKKSPVTDAEGRTTGIANVAHDVTNILQATRKIEAQQRLLSVLHRGLTDYQTLMSADQLWQFLHDALLDLTDSDYALIGEVVDPEQEPALKIHAITDLSWDDDSRALMAQLRSGDMLLENPDTLLGRVFAGHEVVMTNDLQAGPGATGFPEGHPSLRNYLGVPIEDQGKVIGMFAIANCRQALTDELVEWLEPFTATCALLINLYRQMAERERFLQELETARDEQARASRAKTEFLSAMSHELRTPLNSVIGFSQLLLNSRKHPLPERQRKQVKQIAHSGQHLLTLINEVLDLARIESGGMAFSIEPVSLDDAVRESMETVSSIAETNGITMEPIAGQCGQTVLADYTRLKQVLINLLSNAVKYNRPAGRISIRCGAGDGGRTRITVSDTGPGIPPGRQTELFQPFNRLGAENSSIEGSGVGLALTRQMVEEMNGHIGLDSTLGEGSAFWVELPLADGASAPAGDPEWKTGTDDASSEQRPRVLYVDDNPTSQRLMADIFEDLEELELRVAHDAELGLEMARTEQPGLVLVDIHLPGMDGQAFVDALRADAATRDIPAIGLSADIRQTGNAGFDDHLTKPIDIDSLLRVLDDHVGTA